MTEYTIQQQVKDMREILAKAAETKETALKFLEDAGIITSVASSSAKREITAKQKTK